MISRKAHVLITFQSPVILNQRFIEIALLEESQTINWKNPLKKPIEKTQLVKNIAKTVSSL